jgi:hypothetical protein
MPKKNSSLKAVYEAKNITVSRLSDAHAEDVLISTRQVAALIDTSQPRMSELMQSAACEVVANKGAMKLYWQAETLSRVARHWSPPKMRKGEKSKEHTEKKEKEEKPGPLERRRIRVLDIKIAKDEQDWIPVELAVHALSSFLQEARSIFTSCVPLLRRKYADEIKSDVYQFIDDHMTEVYNSVLDLDFDLESEDGFDESEI